MASTARRPPITATAIAALMATVNPRSPLEFVSPESALDEEPKPSSIVLLSRTVILPEHNWPPRNNRSLLHSHESINIHINAKWVADNDLMFLGCVKPCPRVRHKLRPLRVTEDSKTSCFRLTVNRYLVSVWVGWWESVRHEVNRCAVEFERRKRLLSSEACGKIKSFKCGGTLYRGHGSAAIDRGEGTAHFHEPNQSCCCIRSVGQSRPQ